MRKRKLTEMYGLEEGPFDDVERQLSGAQSLRGGPTTSSNVRKHQDRARRHTPDTAKAQSDMDSAKSIFDGATNTEGNNALHLTDQEADAVGFLFQNLDFLRGRISDTVMQHLETVAEKVEDAGFGGGIRLGSSDYSSSTSMSRVSSRKTPFGGGM